MGFLSFSAPRIIKSHESHRRSSKKTCTNFQNFYPRALSEFYKTNGFSTFMLHELARATFARSFNGVRAPARGHNPLQIIPCGPNLPQKCDQLLCEFRELLRCPLEKNTMRGTCARRRVVMYRCASVVATVVRTPRSEVSERHRAGSWVWVVAKSRLDIW